VFVTARRVLTPFLAALGLGAGAFACGSEDAAEKPKPSVEAGADGAADGGDGADGAPDSEADAGGDAVVEAATPTVLFPKSGLEAAELGVLVNENDPQSKEVADHYVAARKVPAANVVKLAFPVNDVMTEATFATAKAAVDAALGASVQALVVSWTRPYRVACMSVTSAFALGFDKQYCNTTGGGCGPTALVDSYDSDSVAPFTDHGIRPSMMLVGKDAASAKALIDRGVASDDTFPTGDGYLIRTTDTARSVRWPYFVTLTGEWTDPSVMKLTYLDNSGGSGQNQIENQKNVFFYFTGLATVPKIETNVYRPGAIADHLTSFGGQVPVSSQMSIAKWTEAGVTGSFGTVVEPCNYPSKFPDPRVVVPRYYRGETLLEAYWKSVAAPGEGLFVGEPLARPFGAQAVTFAGGTLTIETTHLDPAKSYAIERADAESGPFALVQGGISVPSHQRAKLTVSPADAPYYRLRAE
jgi:uncharacterized protein (TIGR03790 family)